MAPAPRFAAASVPAAAQLYVALQRQEPPAMVKLKPQALGVGLQPLVQVSPVAKWGGRGVDWLNPSESNSMV